MAAGDTSLILTDTTSKSKIEHWLVTTNGTTGVIIPHALSAVKVAQATWAEDMGSATADILEVTVTSGNIATVTCAGATTKNAYVTLAGY